MKFVLVYIIFPAISYLLGSVSFGLIVAKIKGVDLRGQGSGNVGTTNVIRVLGARLGIAVFCLDMLKGAAPALGLALIARAVGNAPSWKMLGMVYGACAIFGHVYPAFHELRGGKAVATSCGVFLCLAPLQTLTAAAVWAVVLMFWKYVSVASMTAAGSFFLMVLLFYPGHPDVPEKTFMTIFALLAAAVVLYRHRANIKRLKEGTEPKIMTSKKDLRAKEAEKKYGKDRLRGATGRRIRTRTTETLRRLAREKNKDETDNAVEADEQGSDEAAERDEDFVDSQQLETEAPLDEVEEISADAVDEPIPEEKNTDTQETRELQQLEEAPEEKDEERKDEG